MPEGLDTAATRVWAASECLKKAGAMVNAPLTLVEATADGVMWLESGEKAIASFAVSVREVEQPLVFALLVRKVKEGDQVLERVQLLNSQDV
jgi:enediyne polyketide synthase